MQTYIRACMHAYTYTYTHAYIHTYIHTYVHTYIHTCRFAYIHTYIHIHTYMHTYCRPTYIHTYIHAYIHVYIYRFDYGHNILICMSSKLLFHFEPITCEVSWFVFTYYHPEIFFSKGIVFSCVCDFVVLSARRRIFPKVLFTVVSVILLYYYLHGKEFFRRILFSVASVILFYYPLGKEFFQRILFWAVSVILFYYYPPKFFFFRRMLFWAASVILFNYFYPHRKNFPKDVVLSCVCDFFLFSFIYLFMYVLYVTTITLESLNQSEPNFHTWLLTGIAQPSSKMGIAGQM